MLFIKKYVEKGQGMAEYALIIGLVALAAAIILGLFGEQLVQVYCRVVFAVDPAAKVPMCEKLSVTCSGMSGGTVSGFVKLEALVTDTIGKDDVKRVEFKIDGALHNQENNPRWCLKGGDSACDSFDTRTLSNGPHTFRAVAYDAEGNAGYCEVTVNVQN
ncbi:MAG: hypothetical protein KJ064_15705 [Anaerolineae bacterium]|nr:hypothetical protein [Anaerolineae bacterium]